MRENKVLLGKVRITKGTKNEEMKIVEKIEIGFIGESMKKERKKERKKKERKEGRGIYETEAGFIGRYMNYI